MFKPTTLSRSLCIAFGSTACAGVLAQTAPPTQPPERIEITGSAIRRIDAETAVPVTVLKIDELKAQGITSVEQVLAAVTTMQTQVSTSQVVGAGTGGASFADLRGIGPNKTLVLLNGRRIANNALDSSAPDLNTIPFGALERVEVLRDGASALYGTDAIGGVINFITRKSLQGGSLTLGADRPQHAGGNTKNANVGYGYGDLDRDRFNVFGYIDVQRQDAITGSQRGYGANGKTSPTTFPGTYFQDGASATPGAPDCVGTYIKPKDATNCVYNPNLWVDYTPKAERESGMLRGTVQLGANHQLSLEYFATQSSVWTTVAPVPYGNLTVNPGTPFYPGNGSTPPAPASIGLDPTQPIHVRFRDEPNGGRREQTDNVQQRFVAALEGTLAGWDYQTGIAFNQNRVTDKLIDGYTDGTIIDAGVRSGVINPFGEQTADGAALLASAYARGTLQTAKGNVSSIDARASRELGDWLGAGRPAAFAVGTEARHESFKQIGNPEFDALVVASTGFDPATDNEGSRNVVALYTELNVPLLKTLDVTAAVRYDRYSDFGSSSNPKFSFRYQPVPQVLLRGAHSTGFRAPSLYELNSALTYTNTANSWDDPVRCPGGVPIAGAPSAANCQVQFISLNGGNKDLKPETAKNSTIGIVFEPLTDLSIGLDFWWVTAKQQIGQIDDNTVFSNPVKFAGLFHRAPDGSLSTDGSQCPGANCGYVELTTQNLGGVRTRGVDLSASWRLRPAGAGNFNFSLNSTYVSKYEYQTEEGGEWIQNVGLYSGAAPIFRWQHTLNAMWNDGPLSLGVTGHYKSGYLDQDGVNRVAAYATVDAYGAWQVLQALTLTLGVRNLSDRNPPFSGQAATFQQGYDPRFADATGRVYYVRGSYSF